MVSPLGDDQVTGTLFANIRQFERMAGQGNLGRDREPGAFDCRFCFSLFPFLTHVAVFYVFVVRNMLFVSESMDKKVKTMMPITTIDNDCTPPSRILSCLLRGRPVRKVLIDSLAGRS